MRSSVTATACAAMLLGGTASANAEDESHLAFFTLEAATASAPADTVLYDFGFALGWYAPHLDLAASFGGASAPLLTGDRTALNFAPSVGYHTEWNDDQRSILQLYGAFRLPLQRRSGADLPGRSGIAAAGEAGVRLWGCGTEDRHLRGWCVGVTLGVRYQHHLTDFQMGPAVLPSGSGVLSFPVTFGIAINPNIR